MPAVLDSDARSPSLQERKQTFARHAIWDAAIDLFSEQGYDETTVEEIAAKAGASRRSFFRHFESKSDLMAQPVLDWGEALVAAVEAAETKLTGFDLLEEIVRTVAPQSASNPRARKLLEIAAKYPAAQEAQLSRVVFVQQRLIAALRRRGNPPMQAHLLSGIVFAVLSTAHYTALGESGDNITVTVHRVLQELRSLSAENSAHAISKPASVGRSQRRKA